MMLGSTKRGNKCLNISSNMDLKIWIFGSFDCNTLLYSSNTGKVLNKAFVNFLLMSEERNRNNLSSQDNISDFEDFTVFVVINFTFLLAIFNPLNVWNGFL